MSNIDRVYVPPLPVHELIQSVEQARAILLPFSAKLEEIAEWMRQHTAKEQHAAAFRDTGLCMGPSMPEWLVNEVIKRHTSDPAKVPPLIVGYYRRKEWRPLQEMVNDWRSNRFFSRRMLLIEDAVWAHLNKRYSLSVFALSLQVEGLIWDWLFEFVGKDKIPAFVDEKKKERKTRANGTSKYVGNIVVETIGSIEAVRLTQDQWTSMRTLV